MTDATTILTRFREESWVLVGHRRGPVWLARKMRHRTGEPASVGFDAAWVLAREEQYRDVVGFLHTHPPGLLRPSGRDVRTMRAWCGAFGKPLLCLIASGDRFAGWRFDDDESEGVRIAALEQFSRGAVVAVDGSGPISTEKRRRRRTVAAPVV